MGVIVVVRLSLPVLLPLRDEVWINGRVEPTPRLVPVSSWNDGGLLFLTTW